MEEALSLYGNLLYRQYYWMHVIHKENPCLQKEQSFCGSIRGECGVCALVSDLGVAALGSAVSLRVLAVGLHAVPSSY